MKTATPDLSDPVTALPAIKDALGAELQRVGVRTWRDLRNHGWKEAFKLLVARYPNRLTEAVAVKLCAAEMGKRAGDLGQTAEVRARVFADMMMDRWNAEHFGTSVEEMQDRREEREERHLLRAIEESGQWASHVRHCRQAGLPIPVRPSLQKKAQKKGMATKKAAPGRRRAPSTGTRRG